MGWAKTDWLGGSNRVPAQRPAGAWAPGATQSAELELVRTFLKVYMELGSSFLFL